MAHLVRRKLPQTREHHREKLRRGGVGAVVRRHQALGNQEVLTIAKRSERYTSLNDLARARIDKRTAIGPTARRSMYPLNHVVTYVHRIDMFRHHFDAQSIFVTNRFKRLVPPAGTIKQRRAHGFRRTAIDVVNNRFDSFADTRRWILLLQTMTRDETLGYRLFDRRGKVHVINAEITGARIEHARLVTCRRQLNKRVTLAHGDRLGHRDDLPYKSSRGVASERERRFNFRVLREVLRVRQVKRAATRIEPIRALLSALQGRRHFVNVAQIKIGRVHKHASALLGCDFETPQRGFSKRVFHRKPFIRVIAVRAKTIIRRDEQHAWSTAIETHDRAVAELTAIESDVVRADARGQRLDVQKLAVPLVDLEPDLSGLRVPVKSEEAGKLFHALYFIRDGLCLG